MSGPPRGLIDSWIAAQAAQREAARRWFAYDPATGRLFRRVGVGWREPVARSGSRQYVHVVLPGVGNVVAQRVVWLLLYGWFPADGWELNHINGDPVDNRLGNLEVVTRSENVRHGRNCARTPEAVAAQVALARHRRRRRSAGLPRVRARPAGEQLQLFGMSGA